MEEAEEADWAKGTDEVAAKGAQRFLRENLHRLLPKTAESKS